ARPSLAGVMVLALACVATVGHTATSPAYARTPLERAAEARGLEDLGAYARAVESLKALRATQPLDADLEIALALDEARSGAVDSAAARLRSPLLELASRDSMP